MARTSRWNFIRYILLVSVGILTITLCASHIAVSGEEQRLAAVESYIIEQMQINRIPGLSVGIIEDNEVVYLRGFGKADSNGREVTPQTPFIIGSMSKSFTALAVMQLVEAGKIELDTPVQQYLPEFRLADERASSKITIRNLLHQTSGISNIAGLRQCLGKGDKTIEQAVQELSTTEPAYEVGARFQYSNSNYIVLGLLVKTVSRESYGEYIHRNVFEPLEMRNSFTSQTEAMQHGMAIGYRRWFGIPVAADLPYLSQSVPSGYIISSAEDITHFLMANMDGGRYGNISVLSPDGIDELHEPGAQAGSEYYGMGWVIGSINGLPAIWHHGSTANYHSTMLIEEETGRAIVVLTNVGLFEVWHVGVSKVIAEGIASLLRGETPSDYGLGISNRYLISDIIAGLFTAGMILFIVLLPRWRKWLITNPPDSIFTLARRIVLPILVDLTWPLIILIGFPMITHLPSWSYWLLYQPDFTCWLIAMSSLALVKALIQTWISYSLLRQVIGSMSKRGLITSLVAVEVLFLALFFLVMFLSKGPAAFALGILILALLLDVLAFPPELKARRKIASSFSV